MRAHTETPIVTVEIGANTGCGLLLSLTENPSVHVHAFEAIPSNCEALLQNLALNNLTNRASVNCVALHDQAVDHIPLRVPDGKISQGGSTMVSNADKLVRGEYENQFHEVRVATMTLDEYFDTHALTSVELIKIDVEANEFNVLKGARRTLAQFVPLVIVETGNA